MYSIQFPSISRCLSWRLAALSAMVAAMLSGCSKPADPPPMATPQVGVVTLAAEDLTVTTELSGRAKVRASAEIRPQVGGIVRRRLFEEGALVQAGQLLYELEPTTYQAAYASAQAAVAKAESTLRSARSTAERNAGLAKIEAVSRQTAEDSDAMRQQAEASLAVAKADLETARVNLGFTRITSPISGRVDLSAVSPGALVTAGQTTAMTTVRQLDPLVADVTQSSTELLRLRREIAAGTLAQDVSGSVAVDIVLEDGTAYAQKGRLQFHGTSVDEATGMVTLRALVPNPRGVLLPGMYLRAIVREGVAKGAVLAPEQGLTRDAGGGATALVVGDDGKVAQRTLELGRAVGNRWQVLSGLAAGDRLMVKGANKVRAGQVVQAVAPNAGDATATAPAAVASAPQAAASSAH